VLEIYNIFIKGEADCLKGLTFVVTGVLESMEREEACTLIKDLGGKVTATVGKRLSYMVVGEEAGPKKLAKAEELEIPILNEDGLFELIRGERGNEHNVKHNYSQNETTPKQKLMKNDIKEEVKGSKSPKNKIAKCENLDALKYKSSPEKRKHKEDDSLELELSKQLKIESQEKEILKREAIKTQFEHADNFRTRGEILAWVDKYKPTNIKQIIGQQGAASNSVKYANLIKKSKLIFKKI
jgi:replication factor C subunit 1